VGMQDDKKKVALPAAKPPPPAGNFMLEDAPAGKVPRVLVLEDEPTVASLLADVLRKEGMKVDGLLDGSRARQHLTHVAKPLRMEELSTAVHGMLAKKKEIAAGRASVKPKEA